MVQEPIPIEGHFLHLPGHGSLGNKKAHFPGCFDLSLGPILWPQWRIQRGGRGQGLSPGIINHLGINMPGAFENSEPGTVQRTPHLRAHPFLPALARQLFFFS